MVSQQRPEDIDAETRNASYIDQPEDYGVWSVPGLMQNLPGDENASFRILEIGCGYGHSSAAIKERYRNAEVVAGDVIQECLDKTKARYPDVETVWFNADRDLPFEDGEFDYVFSSNLFEHLHNDEDHLQEVRRILRPDGAYLISTPNLWIELVYYGLLRPEQATRFISIWSRLTGSKKISHCNLQTVRSLRRRLEAAGFRTRVQRREDLSNTEQRKLAGTLDWLPTPLRKGAFAVARGLWRSLPPEVQPSIVVVGRRTAD